MICGCCVLGINVFEIQCSVLTCRLYIFMSQQDAERVCLSLKHMSPEINCKPSFTQCTFCGGPTATNSFHILSNEGDSVKGMELGELTMTTTEQVRKFFSLLCLSFRMVNWSHAMFLSFAGTSICFCVFQDTLRCTCCLRGSTIVKSHVMGDGLSSRASWCVLEEPQHTLSTTLDTENSNTRWCSCLHVCVSYSRDLHSRSDSTRAALSRISFS